MNKLDRISNELKRETVSKSTFEESLKDMIKKAKSWLSSFGKKVTSKFRGAKIVLQKVGQKILPFYKRKGEVGLINPKTGKSVMRTTTGKTHRTILINPKQ